MWVATLAGGKGRRVGGPGRGLGSYPLLRFGVFFVRLLVFTILWKLRTPEKCTVL